MRYTLILSYEWGSLHRFRTFQHLFRKRLCLGGIYARGKRATRKVFASRLSLPSKAVSSNSEAIFSGASTVLKSSLQLP